ncbi:MAG: nuclear transport factor 2 family protein [Nocardioides sp.]
MEELRAALETKDLAAVEAMLADDVVFRSPALHRPYRGRAATMVFITAASEVLEDFRYVRTFTEDDGRGHVLMFAASVGGRELEGVDIVSLDDDGRITEFRVMVRPMTGLVALAEAMAPRVAGPLAGLSPG